MKLVIKIDIPDWREEMCSPKLAWVLSQLLAEGHRITVIHGDAAVPLRMSPIHPHNEHNGSGSLARDFNRADMKLMVLCGVINKQLVAALSGAGIAAMGLCGIDGSLVRLRKDGCRDDGSGMEIASVDPFWLDAITQRSGVPVVANVALGPDGRYHYVNPERLAAACAVEWNADTLIFLADSEGLKDDEGTVQRWLTSNELDAMKGQSAIPPDLLSKLQACQFALNKGVHRTRIFPMLRLEDLALFYSARLESGTEVILSL